MYLCDFVNVKLEINGMASAENNPIDHDQLGLFAKCMMAICKNHGRQQTCHLPGEGENSASQSLGIRGPNARIVPS